MVKIATWNVNSIRAHLDQVLTWLKSAGSDIVLLQEIKCVDESFPVLDIQSLGYRAEISGQKSYNGVAILSRLPLSQVHKGLPGDDSDLQARYIEALADDGTSSGLRVASLYLPNGNPIGSDKFPYKLAWMDRLYHRARRLLHLNEAVVLGGDYNICPTDDDVYDPSGWAEDALCHIESRSKFRSLLNLGYSDAIAALHSGPGNYTFWDYQAGAWEKNHGLRIDHFLLSPMAIDRLDTARIERSARGDHKPSDHVPVEILLKEML